MVTAVMTTMEGDLHAVDFKLQRELRDLVDYLNRTKAELAALRGGGDGTIPTATDELDAVIATTQDAAGQILDCAEQLQDFAATLPEEQGSLILGLATRIFEASNFQDLTGQRITKVVRVLHHIEARLNEMAAAAGETLREARAATGIDPTIDEVPLHGPAMPGSANSQDDIDAILAGM